MYLSCLGATVRLIRLIIVLRLFETSSEPSNLEVSRMNLTSHRARYAQFLIPILRVVLCLV